MYNKKEIQRTIKEAAGLVEGVDEPYGSLAFSVIFADLLRSPGPEAKKPPASAKMESRPTLPSHDRLQTMLHTKLDWSELPIINRDAITQNLMVLKLALDKFKIDGLSAKDIQQVLFQKYRISKTPNAVSMSLMAAVGKYVDRIQEGKEFLYRITDKGIAKLGEEKRVKGEK